VVFGNRILDALPDADAESFRSRVARVDLSLHDVVYAPGKRYADVHFPITCVLSTTVVTSDGDEVEVATIGLEGFDPVAVLVGTEESPYRTVCQVPGASYRMPLDAFLACLDEFPALRTRARAFGQGFLQFTSQSIACNRLHPLLERCARWLLMTHDRVPGDEFALTQEYLAVMLGVHRPAVNVAARTLAAAGLIAYRRGSITVLDREGLESASCECYAVVAEAYARLLDKK
jgi:CRP-like cAMP-binding protein